jgi:tripartite-type tricarboxylate transporter receptor subunit TctC
MDNLNTPTLISNTPEPEAASAVQETTTQRGRRQILRGLAGGTSAIGLGALGLPVAGPATAQPAPWPRARPIKIIIPFTPGNTLDIMSRLVSPKLAEALGTNVIVENMAGAGGRVGMIAIARAAPDGYTIGGGQGGTLVVLPHTTKDLNYDALKDFAPIAISTTNYLGVVGANNAPFKSIQEMVTWARANPGKLTIGTNGEGGFPHLAFEELALRGGFTFTHVPYKGSAGIVTDLAGGQILAAIDGISGITSAIKGGTIRLLAVTNTTKVKQWPGAATVNEAVPGFSSGGWFGYVAPAGTPAEIVNRLNQAINEAMRSPEVVEKLDAAGLIVVDQSPAYFADLIRKDYKRYGDLVKSIGYEAK